MKQAEANAKRVERKRAWELIDEFCAAVGMPSDEFYCLKTETALSVKQRIGDSGTCVIGERMFYKGVQIAEGIVQGCITNETFFAEFKNELVARGFDPKLFSIDYGRMD